jgi:hypothetical protein
MAAPRFKKRRASQALSLRHLTRLAAEIGTFPAELESASDRGAAIFMASNVERVLERLLIEAVLQNQDDHATRKRLVDRDGALETFYGKNYLGYALGLYDEELLYNLERIRELRNTFAHAAIPLRFDHPRIAAECARFKVVSDKVFNGPPRIKFIAVCFDVLKKLISTSITLGQKKLKELDATLSELNARRSSQ